MSAVTDAHAQAIIEVLEELTITDQVGCLISLIYSHVIAASQSDLAQADAVVHQIIRAMPKQWQVTRAMFEFDRLPPTTCH